MASALVAGAASAQSVICCDQIVPVEGNWVGAGRVADCQQEFDSLPPMDAKKWCKQRNRLACLDMRRCGDFAGDPDAAPEPSSDGREGGGSHASASPDVRDGLEEGFGSPEPRPGTAPPPPTVFFLTWPPDPDGTPVHAFKVWLDDAGCALPIEPDGGTRGTATRMVLGSGAPRPAQPGRAARQRPGERRSDRPGVRRRTRRRRTRGDECYAERAGRARTALPAAIPLALSHGP
jgi:hypothetical protein